MSSRRGQGYVYKRASVFWIGYSIAGKKYQESARTRSHADAVRLLTQRLTERGRGLSRRDLEKVQFSELANLIRADYEKNGRKSVKRLKGALKHLTAAFSDWRVVDIGEDVIDRYAVNRLAEGAAPATTNRELATFRRMLRLGVRAKMVGRVPIIDLLKEDNVRTGFFEEAMFQAVRAELPERLHSIADVGYVTGWRKEEILSRRWRHVNMEAGWLRIRRDEERQRPAVPLCAHPQAERST